MPVVAPRPTPTVSTIVAVSAGVRIRLRSAVDDISPEVRHQQSSRGWHRAQALGHDVQRIEQPLARQPPPRGAIAVASPAQFVEFRQIALDRPPIVVPSRASAASALSGPVGLEQPVETAPEPRVFLAVRPDGGQRPLGSA